MEESKNTNNITQFGEWVLKKRWLVLVGSIIATILLSWGGANLKFNNDYHVFFDEGDEQIEEYDALEEKFTKNENVLIAIAPRNGKVFTKETLLAIKDLEGRAWQTPWSYRVDALSNFQNTTAEGDDMYVTPLYEDANDLSPKDMEEMKSIALKEPILLNRMVNKDASVTAINISVQIPDSMDNGAVMVAEYTREMVEGWKKDFPNHETYLSGVIMMNDAFAKSSMNDMSSFIPLMFLIIILAVAFATKSISNMISAFLVLICSIMAAMGIAGFMGIELTGPSSSAPTMIMTLAIADSIHLLVTVLQLMRDGRSKNEAIVEGLRLNFKPILLTSVTTIIGFLTLNFSEGAPYRDLGNITAIGVTFAFVFSLFLLPALVSILPLKVKIKQTKTGNSGFYDRIAQFVIEKYKTIIIGSTVLIIGLGAISFNNELNNEFIKFFDKSIDFRTDTDFISENLTGIYTVEFSLNSGEIDGITDPSYLSTLDNFQTWLKQQDEVVHISSLSEVFKKVNMAMHGNDKAYYQIPKAKDEASQYLLLYEMSLPYGLDLNNQINVDKSESRYTITVKNLSSNHLLEFSSRCEEWLKENAPKHMFSYGVSPNIVFSRIAKTNVSSMLVSGIGALFIISLLLIFTFKSGKYGAVSFGPNLAPVVCAFGIWYIFRGEINMGMAATLGMTLGIVVDNAIHFLSKYIKAKRELNKTAEEAIRYAFSTVARAILVTNVILILGFMVLTQSSFGLNSDMASLSVITIVSALILDLILLPALLIWADRKNTNQNNIKS